MSTTTTGDSAVSGRERLPSGPRRTPALALPETRWAIAALGLFSAAVAAAALDAPPWVTWTLYLTCYAAGGWQPALSGLHALGRRRLDVDLLMVAAAIGAAAIGRPFDGGLLIVIFATSGAFEALATRRTEDSVRGLLDLTPQCGRRVAPDGSESLVAATDLAPGDEIHVRPGERIAADGRVIGGRSEVDQATITGESVPAAKSEGDAVFAGTVNGTGALRVRVEHHARDSVAARIAEQVERASATKATTQLFIERFEQRYSVGVVVTTLALVAIPLLLGSAVEPTLLRAMTFMIVASPCAVVLATMPPLLAAISTAGRHGILIKNAVVLERLASTSAVAVDKTGTLTTGVLRLREVRLLPEAADAGWDRVSALRLAAAAEHASEHPIGQAIVAAARAEGLSLPTTREFAAVPGSGVTAHVEGHRVTVGAPERLEGATTEPAEGAAAVTELEASGHTTVLLCREGRPIAVLGIDDTVRPDAARGLARLAALTTTPPILLTGDHPQAARRVAAEVGAGDVRARLLPHEKTAAVTTLAAAGEGVLAIGDGINDAPAMAAARTGVAMGRAGADLTLRAADAVVIRDELDAVATVVALARRARRLVVANLAIAGTIIAVLVTWDLFGHLPLPLGVAGHEGSTILVALNGLRLLGDRAWRTAAAAGSPDR